MKINAGETPLEPIYIPDGPPGAKSRRNSGTGKGEKPPFDVLHGGERMIREFYDRLAGRKDELKEPHVVLRPLLGSPPAGGSTESPANQSNPRTITQEHLSAVLASSGFDRSCAEEGIRTALIDGAT